MVEFCVTYRKTVIATTVGIFVLSVLMFKMVPQQFFPPSNRTEILVDLKLEEGASLTATEQAVKKVEQFLSKQKVLITMWPMWVQAHHVFIYR